MKTRQDISKELILETASRLVTTKGVETSLADIADELGISKGTLYYYYPAKSDLIFDITNLHFDQTTANLLERIRQIEPGTPPNEIIRQTMETLIFDSTRGRLHHYLIEEAVTSNPKLKEKFKEKYRQWNEMIRQGLDSLMANTTYKDVVSSIILATVDGLILQTLIGNDDFSVKEIANYFSQD